MHGGGGRRLDNRAYLDRRFRMLCRFIETGGMYTSVVSLASGLGRISYTIVMYAHNKGSNFPPKRIKTLSSEPLDTPVRSASRW